MTNTINISVRLPEDLLRQVDALAIVTGWTRSDIVRQALQEALLAHAAAGIEGYAERMSEAVQELREAVERLDTRL